MRQVGGDDNGSGMSFVCVITDDTIHRVLCQRIGGIDCEILMLVGNGRILASSLRATVHYTEDDSTDQTVVTQQVAGNKGDEKDDSDSSGDYDTAYCCRRHAYNDYDYRGRPEGNRLARLCHPVEQVAPSPQRGANHRRVKNELSRNQPRRHHQTNNQKRQCYGASNNTGSGGGGFRRGRV